MKPILFNFTDSELEQYITELGQPKFRAKQIRDWLNRGAPNFASMKNIPDTLRTQLDETALTLPVRIVKKLESSDGETTKFLLELNDGEQIECVEKQLNCFKPYMTNRATQRLLCSFYVLV